jgi:hypothetical protein
MAKESITFLLSNKESTLQPFFAYLIVVTSPLDFLKKSKKSKIVKSQVRLWICFNKLILLIFYEKQENMSLETLEKTCQMNKVYYFGPDTKYGNSNVLEIITPSLSKISMQLLHKLGYEIINIETTAAFTGSKRTLLDIFIEKQESQEEEEGRTNI